MSENTMLGWHFLPVDRRLRYGDGRTVEAGATYTVPSDLPLSLCNYGLHASERIINALGNAPGPVICRVALDPPVLTKEDKACAYSRRVIAMIDGTDLLRRFACDCALDVVHLWDPPAIVIEYLQTPTEGKRAAAWDGAWDGALFSSKAAARDSAWAAAAKDAAKDAAKAAAWDAAWAAAAWDAAWAAAARDSAWAAAARDSAWAAAWDAARDRQNRRLEEMVFQAMGIPAESQEGKELSDERTD
jgi:hypothetical protein